MLFAGMAPLDALLANSFHELADLADPYDTSTASSNSTSALSPDSKPPVAGDEALPLNNLDFITSGNRGSFKVRFGSNTTYSVCVAVATSGGYSP
jgi:hypothetical protein